MRGHIRFLLGIALRVLRVVIAVVLAVAAVVVGNLLTAAFFPGIWR